MTRKARALLLLAAFNGGCVSMDMAGGPSGVASRPKQMPALQGPRGEPIALIAPARPAPASPAMRSGESSDIIQAGLKVKKGATEGLPAPPPGSVAAVGALPGVPMGPGGAAMGGRSSVRFTGPAGMKVSWFNPTAAGGMNGFTAPQVEVPGRYNFVQGGVYRLKLTDIPNRPGLELYPTLEVRGANARTATFLAHSAVPVSFTEEDFEQVASGNLVIKVVYLPDPQFQDLAVAGPDEIVSSRLEPGVDPIMEAERRGSVLLVIRIGNIDLEAPNTPALNAPPSGMPFQGMPLMAPPGGVMPGQMPAPLPPGVAPGAAPSGAPTRPAATPPMTMIPSAPKPAAAPAANMQVDGIIGRMMK